MRRFYGNLKTLRKGTGWKFRANTNVPAPFDVYWQMVKSGAKAARANQRHGGFDQGAVERGPWLRYESTAVCSGNHNLRFWDSSTETFIDGCAPIAHMTAPN
ncbi:nucleotide-binding domain-containing protein [Paraburkholderia sediminicola]|uniref:nucleotide-binding domain-containing protein n=1 Tax=Paraburkholderia sediminicola TaxID=458836 RepID=UPI0038B8EE6B